MMKPILLDFPMPIVTPRLILTPPKIGDGKILNAAVLESLEILSQFMPWASKAPSIDDSEEFVRLSAANWIIKNNDEPYLPLFIFDRKSQLLIGVAGYHHYAWNIPSIETGYWLRKTQVNKGYMTEAINAITQYAFKQLGVKRLSLTCDVNNIRSKKIPERLGFAFEGILKSHRREPLTNKLTDTLVYARYNLLGLPDLFAHWGADSKL